MKSSQYEQCTFQPNQLRNRSLSYKKYKASQDKPQTGRNLKRNKSVKFTDDYEIDSEEEGKPELGSFNQSITILNPLNQDDNKSINTLKLFQRRTKDLYEDNKKK